MKIRIPALLFATLAFGISCSDHDDGYSTLNGTWTAETSGFVAEFTIARGAVTHSIIRLKSSTPGEFTDEFELTGGEISPADKHYLRYIQLGKSSEYLRILGLEINDARTTLRGNSWFYYLSWNLSAQSINEEFMVERR